MSEFRACKAPSCRWQAQRDEGTSAGFSHGHEGMVDDIITHNKGVLYFGVLIIRILLFRVLY